MLTVYLVQNHHGSNGVSTVIDAVTVQVMQESEVMRQLMC